VLLVSLISARISIHRPSSARTIQRPRTSSGRNRSHLDRCVQTAGDSLLTCALNPIPLLSVSFVTLSQFFWNTLLSTINAGVLRLLMFFPTNSLTKASLEGRVRRDKGVVVCIVTRWLNVSILYCQTVGKRLTEILLSILRVLVYKSIRVDWYREVADPSGGVGTADGFASVGLGRVG
jgi:hypothetical protein